MMNRLPALPLHQLQKSNSTSSVFATGTITEPNMGELVSSVSTMLHCQVSERDQGGERSREGSGKRERSSTVA
jgi:hypothetical protein